MAQTPEPVFLNLEYIFNIIYTLFAKIGAYIFSEQFVRTFEIVASVLIVLLITSILYSLVRLYEIEQEGKPKKQPLALFSPPTSSAKVNVEQPTPSKKENQTWTLIRTKLLSDVHSDWRLAIIEADIYLDRLLNDRGAHGDTLGDKLKSMNENDFPSLNIAWEAHKVRNRIAHDGQDYTLTQPEARRVLSYYEIVFRDLGAIE